MTPSLEAFCEAAIDALDRLDEWTRPPLEYIINQIMAENREDADVALLLGAGREILRKA